MIPKNAVLLTLAALGPLTGCAGTSDSRPLDPPANTSGEPAPTAKGVDENLARLRALDVFEVGDLIVHYPEGSMNCYGPCPGFEAAIEKAKADAAVSLDKLTDVAESAATSPGTGAAGSACEKTVIDANIAALAALEIVAASGLIQEQPKNNPQCYNLPCPEDTKAAQEITCARADKLAAIAEKAGDL